MAVFQYCIYHKPKLKIKITPGTRYSVFMLQAKCEPLLTKIKPQSLFTPFITSNGILLELKAISISMYFILLSPNPLVKIRTGLLHQVFNMGDVSRVLIRKKEMLLNSFPRSSQDKWIFLLATRRASGFFPPFVDRGPVRPSPALAKGKKKVCHFFCHLSFISCRRGQRTRYYGLVVPVHRSGVFIGILWNAKFFFYNHLYAEV